MDHKILLDAWTTHALVELCRPALATSMPSLKVRVRVPSIYVLDYRGNVVDIPE